MTTKTSFLIFIFFSLGTLSRPVPDDQRGLNGSYLKNTFALQTNRRTFKSILWFTNVVI
uniref:Uncharacterized protein n=1 Tax=Anguilla anguilla TaxID=7936 RepID=A0A0E9Q1Z4_ANGAN